MGPSDNLSKKSSNERMVNELIETVKRDPKRRYDALVKLKIIGNPRSVDIFIERLYDDSSRIRKVSIEALGEMGNKSAIFHLAQIVNTKDLIQSWTESILWRLENIKLAKDAIQKIQKRLDWPAPSSSLKEGVNWTNDDIELLRQSWEAEKSIQIIVKQLRRSPEDVVHKLIETGLIGYNDDNCDPKPVRFGLTWSDQERAQLSSELKVGKQIPEIARIHQRNKNSILHTMVTYNLINYKRRDLLEDYTDKHTLSDNTQIIQRLISDLEFNSNVGLRNAAAAQLGYFREPNVVNVLIKHVNYDSAVRYRALLSLQEIGDPIAIPVFIERLKDPSAKIRLVSVKALGEIGDRKVVEHLESLLNSNDYQNSLRYGGNPEVILAAKEAIQCIHSKFPQNKIEKPEIKISLDRTQLSVGKSHKVGITFVNTGTSPVENVKLTFSSEFETKGIKPISLRAGQSSQMDISVTPTNEGNILLEATISYQDINGREFSKIQEFWIDVVEKYVTPSEPPKPPGRITGGVFPPELSDRYLESEFIGKGGFARVFKAKRKDGEYVAVKLPISCDESTGKSFMIEMENWKNFNHPNIVKLYDCNIMPVPFFEMELCETSLDKIQKPLNPKDAAWIVFYICEGLKYSHLNKIIHRDLKPHNILLKDGIPKISDWGMSKVISKLTTTQPSAFTPFYAAPEQIQNLSKDERTDIWQTGCNSLWPNNRKAPFRR